MFQSGQVSSFGLNSRISYSPKTELDYGNLFCWATNSVGQGSPCVFTILPIGPPDPPAKCRTSNVTYSSFEVGTIVTSTLTAKIILLCWNNTPAMQCDTDQTMLDMIVQGHHTNFFAFQPRKKLN